MGWKTSTIIINSDKPFIERDLLNDLGFYNLKEIDKEPYEVAMNPVSGKVFIGKYEENIFICSQNLPYTFLEKNISQGEIVLSKYFPHDEICALVLNSGVNLWGYSVSKNKQKIRVRSGDSDQGTFLDQGDPLEQEIRLLRKSKRLKNGKRIYLFEEYPNETFEEDQVGENYVFELASRYIHQDLDKADDLLFETELNGYEFSDSKLIETKKIDEGVKSNKWLKFVITFVLIVIWQLLRRNFF